MTGYTVAMLIQNKTFVDAAKKAGVEHTSCVISRNSDIF